MRWLVVAALLAPPLLAAAQSPASSLRVSLEVNTCVQADAAEVERLFSLELRASVPDAATSPGADATRVEVSCDGDLIVLTVHDPVTGKSLSRRVRPDSRGRERLIALAVMELLVASWIELEATPTPVVPAADARGGATTRESVRRAVTARLPAKARTRRATTSLLAALGWAGAGAQAGGGLRVTIDGERFGWGADLLGLTGSERVALGEVDAVTLGGALVGHVVSERGRLRLRAAAGARLGAATLRGEASQDDVETGQVTGLVGGPLARATASYDLVSELSLAVSVESGIHVFEVAGRVEDSGSTVLGGPWLTADLAVGWSW